MEKCEKEERFEEAAIARDRIYKLKKMENKKIMQELLLKHEEESKELQNFESTETSSLLESLNMQQQKIEDSKKEAIQMLENKHYQERENLIEEFESKYPAQPKFSPEVLNLQKIMDGYIKNREYEKANEVKIRILNLCEEQDTKHNTETKERKLKKELQKLKMKHNNEYNSLLKKWDLIEVDFKKRGEQEKNKVMLKYKNRFFDMRKMHKVQLIEQERINKRNLVIKPASQSKYYILSSKGLSRK